MIHKKETKYWWIFPLVISAIAFFAHAILHRGNLPSKFCPYFLLLDLLILVLTTAFYYWLLKKGHNKGQKQKQKKS